MSPLSAMISQQSPAGFKPAILRRSTVASVCPSRSNTPPAFARSGNMCPGRLKSSGTEVSETTARAVIPRSMAEIPVLVSLWSIDTVNAVSWLSVLLPLIISYFRS